MTQTVTAALVKQLRERTGVGMGKCKEALVAANGDIDEAISLLRKAGIASAVKREGRETNEGVIKTAQNNEFIALIELNAETDFVVKNEAFQTFAQELAEEVCRTRPDSVEVFLKQKYSKEPQLSIDEKRASVMQSLGENIQIRRFELFPKKSDASVGLYSHGEGHLVTMVEIGGSANEEDLARDIAMHVAAESPEYLVPEEIPERVKKHEEEIARAQIKNKPEHILEKIIEGKLKAYFDQVCLSQQSFVKDSSLTISALVAKRGKESGQTLKINQFLRWHVGQ